MEQEKKPLTEEDLQRAEEIILRLKGEAPVPTEQDLLLDDEDLDEILKVKETGE
jgi:hypothetical protein